jgi:archaellum component FlaF (FlaF/FlaG flagellin family)
MGLSTTAAYGILFTASLVMLSMLLNSLIYSYTLTNQGMENRSQIIQGSKNVIEIDRVVYNSSRVEIIGYNKGPYTLNMNSTSLLLNGSIEDFTFSSPYWYPGAYEYMFISSSYSLGSYHPIQFKIDLGDNTIASTEKDKIYILNSTGVIAYAYSGTKIWYKSISSPIDIASSDNYIYVLNSTEIIKYDFSGNYVSSFAKDLNITAIAASNTYVYGISNNTLYVFDSSGNTVNQVPISNGKDVAVGKYVYVLEGNSIYAYSYTGDYAYSFNDWRITNATKISTDLNIQGDFVFVLNNRDEILVYKNEEFIQDIELQEITNNIDIYGKIYLCASGLYGMDIGYKVKIVDEYGNEFYGFL